jgi:hypothetical protein
MERVEVVKAMAGMDNQAAAPNQLRLFPAIES